MAADRGETILGLLRGTPLLKGIPLRSLPDIASAMRYRHLAPGTVVMRQGDPAHSLYFLAAGRLEATVTGSDPEAPPVGILSAPQWFGELAILTRQPRTATVIAATDCDVWTLSRKAFESLLAGHPTLVRNIMNALCNRIQQKDHDFLGQSSLALENARLALKIQEQATQLELVSKHKSQFLASMSHELRTPLNAIIGFSEVLLDANLGPLPAEEQREFLTNILTSGKHLLRLINDVLDLSKIEAGKMELHCEPIDVTDAVQGVLATVKPLAVKKRIQVASEHAPALPLAWADPPRLKQILYNLLSNAIKFTAEGGRVSVAARLAAGGALSMPSGASPPPQYLQVAVSDTGIGISAQDLERIFREFEQVHDPSRTHEGTGLGLALVKKLVEIHGGRIRVESAPGRGSTFTFTIPTTP
jgi:signal transduction histidine kinase